MRSLSKKANSPLKKQKPKRKRNKKFLYFIPLGIALASSLVYFSFFNNKEQQSTRPKITLNIVPLFDKPFKGKKLQKTRQVLLKNLEQDAFPHLLESAKALQQLGYFESTRLVLSDHLTVTAFLHQRVPFARVISKWKQKIGLTKSGTLYRLTKSDLAVSLPEIRGILSSKKKPKFQRDRTIAISDDTKTKFLQAIDLINQLRSKGLNSENLLYQKHRGFTLVLKEFPKIDVLIGLTPFDGKIERLLQIISKPSTSIAKIELDYMGKAFVMFKDDVIQ